MQEVTKEQVRQVVIDRETFDKGMRDIGEMFREGIIAPCEVGQMAEKLAREYRGW